MDHTISAKVNGSFQFSPEDLTDIDFIALDDTHFHVLSGNTSYRAELLAANPLKKTFTIKINGSRYDIQLADKYDMMVEKLGLGTVTSKTARNINAPMPGLVLKIMVEPGQAVEPGQTLLILEAMKMENVIKAVASGVVETVKVSQGAAVEKGQLLVQMEA
ncbi:MAG: acetyl-CoA carboxylase biotin carboxyl carrier protein subunit [Saprospiraceae bacterium]